MKNTSRSAGVLFAAAFVIAAFIFVNGADATHESCYQYSFSKDLQQGASGDDVTAMQKFLTAKGLLIMPANTQYGYFGNVTKTALIKYQKSVGLKAEGYFGPLTRSKVWDEMPQVCGNNGSSSYYQQPVTTYSDPYYTDPYYSQPTQSKYPTEAQEAAMPVYYASKIPSISTEETIKVKITSPTDTAELVMDDYGYNGSLVATENFNSTITGGSGRYRSFWFYDNLDTPMLYDESSSDSYYFAGTSRTMAHSLTGPTFWIASTFVMDDLGRRSATTSIMLIVEPKAFSDKMKANGGDFDALVKAKDPDALIFDSKLDKIYTTLATHPAAYDEYQPSKSSAESSAAKTNMSNTRVQAELYYSKNNNSYAGVCSYVNMLQLFANAEPGAQGRVNCIDDPVYWRAFITLKENGMFYCADSSGSSTQVEKISGYSCYSYR